MAHLNQKAFERKLQNMSSTQDSIQTVSLWMIHHKKHAEDMVAVWLEQLKKASKADRRLMLFYLANDVLQNSRKKGKEFCNAYTKILRDSMYLLSDKTIKGNVQRVIKIWEERRLFEKDYLEALKTKLESGNVPVVSKRAKEKPVEKEKEKEVKPQTKQKRLPPADFKPSKLIDAVKALRNFEGELTLKESQLNSLRIDASDLESVRQLKDRTGGGKFCEEYELATAKLEEFSEILRREQQERLNVIKALEDGEAFYDTSYGEVKVIVHAYKTFGNRLTSLKKKVDAKVNRLAEKAAEKAKTGPVTAPQASFLSSGLPDVEVGSASSTPSQTQQETVKSPDEEKLIDPTVDNIEVADMDVDSDSEKSDTSEEATVEDPKGSYDQTPNSTESSDSQTAQTTPRESETTPVISPAASVSSAQPLTPSMVSVMPVPTSLMANQGPVVRAPQPAVGMVIRPFVGVQGPRFHSPAPQFRPGIPPLQPLPGIPQNPLLQPSRTLTVPGQLSSQGQPFSQIPQPAGLLPATNTPIPRGIGAMQPFALGTGFVQSQAPLPVAATTVPAPAQLTPNLVPVSETSQVSGGPAKNVASIGSPDSEASAPSPVGSPELHLEEGDETPETTPAPLGDVDVKDNAGFDTNKSFLETQVKNSASSLGLGIPGTSPTAQAISEASLSSSSTPSNSDQFGAQQQDATLGKKDSGQKVSAVDILAQLLSRGRKLKEAVDPENPPASVPVTPTVAASATTSDDSGNPQAKPLLSLIDSLFPKLSDSIKTLKEKEQSVNPTTTQDYPPSMPGDSAPTTLPARPLPVEGQLMPHPKGIVREPSQQTGLKSILKKGPRKDQDQPEFETNQEGPTYSNLSEEVQMAMHLDVRPGDALSGRGHDLQQLELHGIRPLANTTGAMPPSTNHLTQPGLHFQTHSVRGPIPRVPQERPFGRPLDLSPHGPPPFGPRGLFQGPRGPPFDQSRGNTGLPFTEGPTDMPGPARFHSPRGPPFERRAEEPPGRVPTDQPLHGHSPRRPTDVPEQIPLHGPPHGHIPRGPPFERRPEGPPDMPGKGITDQPPHRLSPRGPPAEVPECTPLHGPPRAPPADISERVPPSQSPHTQQRPPEKVHHRSVVDTAPPHSGGSKPLEVPADQNHPRSKDEGGHMDGPPGKRRLSAENVARGLQRQLPHEKIPRSDGPPPHRASFPGAMEDPERRREFEPWEEYRRERYRDHPRGPWDFPHEHPGHPPSEWRGPPVLHRGDPNGGDFREDDPSMWTSFDTPENIPRQLDFPGRTRERFREGPPDFDRFRGYGPPERRRHSLGDFEGDWVRYPGPLKRPGPPPVPFPGPSKRPYF